MSLDDFAYGPIIPFMAVNNETHGATATPPWWVGKPQRGRCGSSVGVYRVRLLLLASALFIGGCRHLPTMTDTGTSSFAFVEPPPVPPRKATMAEPSNGPILEEHYVEAEPIPPLATPVYPAKALAAKAGLVTIGVKISVDTDGRISDVSPSLLTFSTPTRYSDEFEKA